MCATECGSQSRGSSHTHSHNSITKVLSQVHLGIAQNFLLYFIELLSFFFFFLKFIQTMLQAFLFFIPSLLGFTNLQTECVKWVLCLECLIWLLCWIRNELEADTWQVSGRENWELTENFFFPQQLKRHRTKMNYNLQRKTNNNNIYIFLWLPLDKQHQPQRSSGQINQPKAKHCSL